MIEDKNADMCMQCNKTFKYKFIHDGFNESAHAYCNKCGMACILNDISSNVPKGCNLFKRKRRYSIIDRNTEKFLRQCTCGGSFKHNALPRCPYCNAELPQFENLIFKTVVVGNERVDDWWKEPN